MEEGAKAYLGHFFIKLRRNISKVRLRILVAPSSQ
jgi:hypothetical protein